MHGMQPGKFDPGLFRSFDQKFVAKSQVELAKGFDACAPQTPTLVKK
jgi:hypothetical protein